MYPDIEALHEELAWENVCTLLKPDNADVSIDEMISSGSTTSSMEDSGSVGRYPMAVVLIGRCSSCTLVPITP